MPESENEDDETMSEAEAKGWAYLYALYGYEM